MPATAVEQMILELINRARLDPAAEAARDGIDLNEGLAAGTISTVSKQPLAMNETLLSISRAHDQDMLAHQYFDHTDSSGESPFDRMTAAGYDYSAAGENIAWNGTTGTLTQQMTVDLEQQLFVDSGVSGRGHRLNLLDDAYQEVGDGVEDGAFMGYNATLITEDFGAPAGPTTQFLTGVSYNDTDHNNFYSIGEGRNGVSVSVAGGGSTATAGAGGYSLAIGAGQQTVTFSGGGLASPVTVGVTIAAGTNAKVDMVDQGVVTTSTSLADLGGATRIIALGTIGLTLTGDTASETFNGTSGDDVIVGGGGFDTMDYSAARSSYSVTELGSGLLRVSGPDGTDSLSGISRLAFSDQTVNASFTAMAAGDFNGDGLADILWRNTTTGDTETWFTNASGGFAYANDGAPGLDWEIAGVGDFNGDGKADLLWRNQTSGDVYLYASNGSGGFNYQDLGVVSTSWQIAGVGDFSNDGRADILWRNSDGSTELWRANPQGGFTYADLGNVSTDWQVASTADLNGDGSADILWRNETSGATESWITSASGGFTYADDGAPSLNWQIAATGDLNGDGKADILWRDTTSGDVFLYASKASGGYDYQDLGVVSLSWQLVQTGDYNGDGLTDILWRNTATGQSEFWYAKAGGGFNYGDGGTAPSAWTVAS